MEQPVVDLDDFGLYDIIPRSCEGVGRGFWWLRGFDFGVDVTCVRIENGKEQKVGRGMSRWGFSLGDIMNEELSGCFECCQEVGMGVQGTDDGMQMWDGG